MNESIKNKVHSMVAELVRMPVDELDTDINLLDIGADSILITELVSHIKSNFGVEIPINFFYSDMTSVSSIANYVSEHFINNAEENENDKQNINETTNAQENTITYVSEKNAFPIEEKVDQQQVSSISNEYSLIGLLKNQLQIINNQIILLQNGTTKNIVPNNVQISSVADTKPQSNANTDEKIIKEKNDSQIKAYVPFKALNLEKKQFNEEKQACLEMVQKLYTEKTKLSKSYAAKYRKPYADCRSISGFRPNMKEMCYQLIFKDSDGAYITDIDNNHYIDLAMDFGVSLFGHNQKFISDAINEEMKKGYPLSLVSGLSGEVASLFCELTGMDRAAFFNSGTEAVMVAVRISRAYTNKKKVVIFSGSYHGTFDGVLGMSNHTSYSAMPIANGILQEFVNDLIILEYGTDEALEYIEKNKKQIAAVLVEPVQSRRPDLQPHEFVKKLRLLTKENQIILIFDEMILGMRLGKKGAQGFYGIEADIATYGKICGGGMPIGIVAGKEKYINCIDGGLWDYGDDSCPPDENKRTFVAGTFCHHPIAMAASKAVLTKIKESGDELYNDINKKTEYLCTTLNTYFIENNIPISMSYCGSLFRFVLKGNLELFYYLLNIKNVYVWEGRNCFISVSHTYDDINKVIDAVKWACDRLKPFYNKSDDKKKIPITKEQRDIIAFEQTTSSTGMNETCLIRINGNLDIDLLKEAYFNICKRHEILSYHLSDDNSCFVENTNSDFSIHIEKYTEDNIMARCMELAKTSFILNKDTLIHTFLFEINENAEYLFICVHHVLVDGWSVSVLLQELIEIYNSLAEKRIIELREVMKYSDYLNQISCLNVPQKTLKEIDEYINSGFELLSLPEKEENVINSTNKFIYEKSLDLLQKYRNTAKKLKCSSFIYLLTGFQAMLYLVTDKKYFTIGIPFAGQQKFIMSSIVGNCTRINMLKCFIDDDTSISSVLNNNIRILKIFSDSFSISEELNQSEVSDYSVNIIFNADRIPNIDSFKGTEISLIPLKNQDSAYDLFVNISEFNDRIIFEVTYNEKKYSEKMINRWMEVYFDVLEQMDDSKYVDFGDFNVVNDYDIGMSIDASKKININEFLEELHIPSWQYDLNDNSLCVIIKNKHNKSVINGSYGYLYLGKSEYNVFATDYIGRILPSGKLEILGKEKDCFYRNGKLLGCRSIKDKLKGLTDFSYLDIAYENNEIVVYFDSETPENTVKICSENLKYPYKPDKYFVCTEHTKSISHPIYENFEGTEIEKTIYTIGSEIIQNKNIGIDDNIIEYGLTSLKLIHLITEIQNKFGDIRIPLAKLEGNYTIRQIGKIIEKLKVTDNLDLPRVKKDSEIENYGVLSSAQKRMLFLNQIDSKNINYNLPYLISVDGILDKNKLIDAVEKCMEIHPLLKARFYDEGEVKYRTDVNIDNIIECVDYYGDEIEEDYIKRITNEFVVPFNLLNNNLFKIKIVNFKNIRNLIFVDFHHIIFDGKSGNILIEDLCKLYNGFEVKKSEYSYASYSYWEKEIQKTDYYNNELNFWKEKLNSNYTSLDMLRNKPHDNINNDGNCGECCLKLTDTISANLKQTANKLECTLFSILTAASSLMLSLYSGEREFAIGTVVEGRNNIVFNNIIGMFVNTLPLIQNIDDNISIGDFIKQSYQNNVEAFDNSDVPFEKIVELGKIKNVDNRNPIFDFLITYTDNADNEVPFGNIIAKVKELPTNANRFELELVANCSENDILLKLLYNKNVYNPNLIERMLNTLNRILDVFSSDIYSKLNEINYCDIETFKKINANFDVGYPNKETVVSLFEQTARKSSDRIAVVFKGNKYSYTQLNEFSNRLAHTLILKGVKTGDLVAIVSERSFEMIVGIIAISKAGGVYVPIDPIYPEERRNYIIEDSKASFILKGNVDIECSSEKEVIDLFSNNSYSENTTNPNVAVEPENNIYIIYTSGTTGNPKGVIIKHKNVVRLMRNDRFQFDFNENDCWTMFHSFCFDFSVWEMYGALLFGGKLVIPEKDEAQDSFKFLNLIEKEHITILNQVPSAFYMLMYAEEELKNIELKSLRYLIFGGEALIPSKLKNWHEKHPDVHIINMYGITETTVHVTYKEIGDKEIEHGISDIGFPIPTLGIYIMRGNQLCDIGMPGEICVYGEGLGKGYLNRTELTEQKFVKNPFGDNKLYRSGDLARITPSGEIEYLGRIDQQVKIRGFRIELEEIEITLRRLCYVRDAVVIIKKRSSGENAIHAYIVSDEEVNFNKIRKDLKESLPEYMIPSYFCIISEIPLTVNGKLNIKALPEILLSIEEADKPSNEIEQKINDIFVKALNGENIGINDNFFSFGGHSIKAVLVINEIAKQFGVPISINTFYKNGTIKNISKIVEEKIEERDFINVNELIPEGVTEGVLSMNQMELYKASIVSKNPEVYNICYPIILKEINPEYVKKTIKYLIERHSILRTQLIEKKNDIIQCIMPVDDCFNKIYKFIYKENELWNDEKIKQFINVYVGYQFKLLNNYLLRINLLKISDDKYLMIYLTHHIISDAWSFKVFMNDFATVYNAISKEQDINMNALPIQYIDYAIWQRRNLETAGFMQKESTYWANVFKSDLPKLNLHTDYERQYPRSMEGDSIELLISKENAEKLKKIAIGHNSTIFSLFTACVNILMYMYTGQNDIVLGTIVAGRNNWKLEKQIGYYLNIIPIRTKFNTNATIEEIIEEASKACQGAFENQNYPYEKIVSEYRVNNKKSNEPLFEILIQYIDWTDINIDNNSLQFEVIDIKSKQSKYDLVFNFVDMPEGTKIVLEYCTELFKKDTIDNMIKRMQNILYELINHKENNINKITNKLSQNEKSLKIKKIQR